MKHYLKVLSLLLITMLFTACGLDDKVVKQGADLVKSSKSIVTGLEKVESKAKSDASFNTFLSYNEFNSAAAIKGLNNTQSELSKLLDNDSSSDEKKVKMLIQKLQSTLSADTMKKRVNSIKEFEQMKKDSGKYITMLENLIEKAKNQTSNGTSERNKALKTISLMNKKYANKSGYFDNKKSEIDSTVPELEAYLVIAKNADENKDKDIEALIALKNIYDNANAVYNNSVDTINSVFADSKELKTVYKKSVIDKKIIPTYYVYYIPTYMLDSYSNPSPSSTRINNRDYNRYKRDLRMGMDVQYINGNESVVVGFDSVNKYSLKFQETVNGKVTSSNWETVDETTFNEMNGHMKKFNSNNIVVEYKGEGQFKTESSTIPYPDEYGAAYTYIGNPAYGHWSGTGSNSHWTFTDAVMAGVVGNMLFGNNNRDYYSRSSYNRNSRYYRGNGYGNHYDRYNDRSYNRSNGNYTRKSTMYKDVKKTQAANSVKDKVQVVKKSTGFTGSTKRTSATSSKSKVSYKSFAKPKAKPTARRSGSQMGVSTKSTVKKTSGFNMPTSRVRSSRTTGSGGTYSSKAKRIKPVAKSGSNSTPKYDMKKRMSGNKALQSRIAKQTKKRINHVKHSDKYKKAKTARIQKEKARKAKVAKQKAAKARMQKEKARKAKIERERKRKSDMRKAAAKRKSYKSRSSSSRKRR